MRDQNWHTIRRSRSNPEAFDARDQRIAFHVSDAFDDIGVGDLAHSRPMHLPLFEEAIATKCHALREARAVLANRVVLISQVKTEVQRVVWCEAHPAGTRCKCMTKSVPIQKGGMQSTHIVLCSMARLHEPPPHAKEAVPQVRAGSSLVHRFPSEEWTAALRVALNNDRAYREVGKAWTFGAVAMIVRSDPANGVEQAAGIILDVHAGECRSARFVEGTDDPADAEFVIVASYARWKDVIEGKLDPIKGMMQGKLKLTRGELPTIIRFVEPSRLLVSSASKVPTDFN
jgi:putative sterol carrier protein